jgi:N-acyl-D-amino-acid deacylase
MDLVADRTDAIVMNSLLLRQAQVIDGTGAPARILDLRVRAGRIAEMAERLRPEGDTALDCAGLTLVPGFIDVHTHDDAQVLREPSMLAKLSQGVTTVVTGNCGLSLVPLVTQSPPSPLDLLHAEQFRYPTLAAYAQAVDAARPSVNVAALIGHTALRAAVMAQWDRPASAAETERMAALLDAGLAQGALGLSSGLFYQPAFAADAQEMKALTQVVGRHGGIYVTHIRSEMDGVLEAMQEAADAAGAGGVPWVLSHHKCAGPRNWGRTLQTLALIERLSARQEVGLDAYPYTAGSTLLREDLVDGVIKILIARSQPHPQMVGRWLDDVAREWGVDQQEACRRLMPGGACYFQIDEDDMRRVLAHPLTMIGSDGLPHDERPHPRLWGAFTRVLSHYCLQERLFDLPQAIHKMSGLSARRFGLKDRGVLRVGAQADLALIDVSRVRDTATYEVPVRMSEGIERVMVNGQWAFAQGQVLGEGAGRFLRR